jgi:peptidoglycan/LPS O-acetylase OafA/YrhL
MTAISKLLRYLIGGVLIGGFWYLNRHRPPWEEALRTIVVFAIVMAVLKMRFKRMHIDVHLVPLVATKAVLVVIAAVVEQGIKHSTSNPSLIVALGLGAAVVLVGSLADKYFFTRTTLPPAPSATPAPDAR